MDSSAKFKSPAQLTVQLELGHPVDNLAKVISQFRSPIRQFSQTQQTVQLESAVGHPVHSSAKVKSSSRQFKSPRRQFS